VPDLIRVGSAGWTYPDWEGIVYPPRRSRDFDPLKYLSEFVDCIEINASFYRIPDPSSCASWAERTADNPDFLFTAKLWRGFTHEAPETPQDARSSEKAFRAAMKSLQQEGRLAAVLVQFPYAFHNTAESRAALTELLDRFADFPLVVEVRHGSWLRDEFLAWLRERGVAFCNIDQPAVSMNIPPTAHVTAPIAYARLHGRNARMWFAEGTDRDRRYDYLYPVEDLAGWVGRLNAMAGEARDVFIIANNHYRGQGLANAIELKSMLAGRPVLAPPGILEAYPRLKGRAVAAATKTRGRKEPAQGVLPL